MVPTAARTSGDVDGAGEAGVEGVDGAQHLQRLLGSATGLPISDAS
jgi:hypothetical protein